MKGAARGRNTASSKRITFVSERATASVAFYRLLGGTMRVRWFQKTSSRTAAFWPPQVPIWSPSMRPLKM